MSTPQIGSRPTYGPLYFLASLGAGGLTVTFFLYLMFWVPHAGRPVPVFEDITAVLIGGSILVKAMVIVAWAGIAIFAALMVQMMVWNLREMGHFKKSDAFQALHAGNAESQMMAIPLALAMLVNGGFILGLVFVPGLWSVVEYLFPIALIAFAAIGLYGLRLYGKFLGRILTSGGFENSKNNSFAQVLPGFAFAMVGVGMAAPAAMSMNPTTVGISLVLSSFFIIVAALISGVAMILGLHSMMDHGAHEDSAPTLLIGIPLLTVIGIALMRQVHGLHVHFGAHGSPVESFNLLTPIVMVQIAFALFGIVVLRAQGYFGKYVTGEHISPGSYALICPGVAMSVMLQFYVNKGLVGMGLVAKFSATYWLLSTPALILQFATIALLVILNAKHFKRGAKPVAMQAA